MPKLIVLTKGDKQERVLVVCKHLYPYATGPNAAKTASVCENFYGGSCINCGSPGYS